MIALNPANLEAALIAASRRIVQDDHFGSENFNVLDV
jgi:hypothetical protein